MFNTIISIPVHEKTEVVIDQIFNIKFFCPNCGIVLHISKRFNYQESFHNEREFRFLLSKFDNVFVNPNQMDTAYADILHTHILNFEYISQVTDFEYFSMSASNELFVRPMPDFKNFDASFSGHPFDTPVSADGQKWFWDNQLRNDGYLKAILEDTGGDISDVLRSQIEGSVYRKKLFQDIVATIKRSYGYNEVFDQNKIVYPREEVYFPTVAHILNKNGNFNFVQNNYTFVAWGNPGMVPTAQEISDVANGKLDGRFSIKRVFRTLDDNLRVAVSKQIGNYRAQVLDFIKNTMRRKYLQIFNLVAGKKRIFICYEQDRVALENIFAVNDTDEFLNFTADNDGVKKISQTLQENKGALFLIFLNIYPALANFLTKIGFRENIDFVDGTLLLP